VRQWLRGADHLSFDVWVESIPFDETRQYVQNVLSYSVIYGQKLNSNAFNDGKLISLTKMATARSTMAWIFFCELALTSG
ncbi:hypothetical protein Q6272_32710, partial [Klebsiella pneumoniae]|uniref:hypothetical protein n=1 Tax=Klebsiella pneumoniae TaxID=573 RepID=UPI002730EC61